MKQSKKKLLREFDKICGLRANYVLIKDAKDFISKAIDSVVKETAIRAQELAKAQIMDKEELKIAQKIGIDSNAVIEAICNMIDNDIIQAIKK